MLRTIFVGSKNEFDEALVHWLSQHSDLQGVVWTRSTEWQRTWRGRLRFAQRRWKRHGLRKTVDETLFFLYYHAFLGAADQAELDRQVIRPYLEAHGEPRWTGDSIFTADVNEPAVLEFLRARTPDVVFAMCINHYFRKPLRQIPRLGVFLWHEGITPEYRGLYSPFWAVHNLDFESLGYSVLRMDDAYDTGAVYAQGRVTGVDPLRHHHNFVGHKAIMDSLPEVRRLLAELEQGTAKPIARPGARSALYTYPGFTDFVRQRFRLRRLSART
jgi:hypothetical protein